jgi:hypothetical protein
LHIINHSLLENHKFGRRGSVDAIRT